MSVCVCGNNISRIQKYEVEEETDTYEAKEEEACEQSPYLQVE